MAVPYAIIVVPDVTPVPVKVSPIEKIPPVTAVTFKYVDEVVSVVEATFCATLME